MFIVGIAEELVETLHDDLRILIKNRARVLVTVIGIGVLLQQVLADNDVWF